MAWYALYKWFRKFRKEPYENINRLYSEYLYREWFLSLSEEEQKREIIMRGYEQAAAEEERRQKALELALLTSSMEFQHHEYSFVEMPPMDYGKSKYF